MADHSPADHSDDSQLPLYGVLMSLTVGLLICVVLTWQIFLRG